VQDVDILTLQDKIEAGDYRSDRFPAVPFVTFADLMEEAEAEVIAAVEKSAYPECGASLTVGTVTHWCHLRMGHTFWSTQQHDWAHLLSAGNR
jgi:hypothetical protein